MMRLFVPLFSDSHGDVHPDENGAKLRYALAAELLWRRYEERQILPNWRKSFVGIGEFELVTTSDRDATIRDAQEFATAKR